jgi:hypothetical protein
MPIQSYEDILNGIVRQLNEKMKAMPYEQARAEILKEFNSRMKIAHDEIPREEQLLKKSAILTAFLTRASLKSSLDMHRTPGYNTFNSDQWAERSDELSRAKKLFKYIDKIHASRNEGIGGNPVSMNEGNKGFILAEAEKMAVIGKIDSKKKKFNM